MTASKNLLLMAMFLLSAVAIHPLAVAVATTAGDGEVRGEGRVDPTAAGGGGYAVCRVGCPDSFFNCHDWCLKSGYKNGGVCVPPQRQQCCCVGPKSA